MSWTNNFIGVIRRLALKKKEYDDKDDSETGAKKILVFPVNAEEIFALKCYLEFQKLCDASDEEDLSISELKKLNDWVHNDAVSFISFNNPVVLYRYESYKNGVAESKINLNKETSELATIRARIGDREYEIKLSEIRKCYNNSIQFQKDATEDMYHNYLRLLNENKKQRQEWCEIVQNILNGNIVLNALKENLLEGADEKDIDTGMINHIQFFIECISFQARNPLQEAEDNFLKNQGLDRNNKKEVQSFSKDPIVTFTPMYENGKSEHIYPNNQEISVAIKQAILAYSEDKKIKETRSLTSKVLLTVIPGINVFNSLLEKFWDPMITRHLESHKNYINTLMQIYYAEMNNNSNPLTKKEKLECYEQLNQYLIESLPKKNIHPELGQLITLHVLENQTRMTRLLSQEHSNVISPFKINIGK